MCFALPIGNPAALLIGIYKPQRGCSTELLADNLSKTVHDIQAKGCIGYAVLKCKSRASLGPVVICAAFQFDPQTQLPDAETVMKGINEMARSIQVKWYTSSCEEHKEGIHGMELSKGAVVHLRGVYTKPEDEDIVSYSCLALLKAYFGKTQGLQSMVYYNSLDRRNIIGLGVWENESEAIATVESGASPALPYWKALGAKLKCGVYEVVQVIQLQPSA